MSFGLLCIGSTETEVKGRMCIADLYAFVDNGGGYGYASRGMLRDNVDPLGAHWRKTLGVTNTSKFLNKSTWLEAVSKKATIKKDQPWAVQLFSENIRKIEPKLWYGGYFVHMGLDTGMDTPIGSVLKLMLRLRDSDNNETISTRSFLFITGVPPSSGGKLWLISPQGFAQPLGSNFGVLAEGDVKILNDDMSRVPPLFGLVSDALLICGGAYAVYPSEEEHPLVLSYTGTFCQTPKEAAELALDNPLKWQSKVGFYNLAQLLFEKSYESVSDIVSNGISSGIVRGEIVPEKFITFSDDDMIFGG